MKDEKRAPKNRDIGTCKWKCTGTARLNLGRVTYHFSPQRTTSLCPFRVVYVPHLSEGCVIWESVVALHRSERVLYHFSPLALVGLSANARTLTHLPIFSPGERLIATFVSTGPILNENAQSNIPKAIQTCLLDATKGAPIIAICPMQP